MALAVKNMTANAGEVRDSGSAPGSGSSSGGRNSNLLQYSCLENPIDRGPWQPIVPGVTESQTQMKRLRMHTSLQLQGGGGKNI